MILRKMLLAAAVLAVFMLSSCSGIREVIPGQTQEKQQEGYSAEQMYVLMAGRREEVSDIYGEQIFSARTDDMGSVFEDTFGDMMLDYITKLHNMKQMCKQRGTELSATDIKVIEARTSDYMKQLSESGNTAGISASDISTLLEDLLRIDRLRSRIMEAADVEVSESDARMADIIIIELSGAEDASSALKSAQENDDFLKLAQKVSEDPNVERTIGAGDLEHQLEEAAFGLEDGEISPILRFGGKYYIIKCVRGYNEEATAVRKAEIYEERLRQNLGGEYEKYTSEHEYAPDEEVWREALRLLKENPAIPDIFSFTAD